MEKSTTQILKEVNDLKIKHEELKNEIIEEVSIFEEKINKKYTLLSEMEEMYVDLMGKLVNQ